MPEAAVPPSLATQMSQEPVQGAEREWIAARVQVPELGLSLVPHLVRRLEWWSARPTSALRALLQAPKLPAQWLAVANYYRPPSTLA